MQIKTFASVLGGFPDMPLMARREIQEPTAMHSHQFVELVVVVGGEGIHRTKFGDSPIYNNTVFIIPRGEAHAYTEVSSLKLYNVIFDPGNLPMPSLDFYKQPGYNILFNPSGDMFSPQNPYPQFRISGNESPDIRNLLAMLQKECRNHEINRNFCRLGLFMALIGRLARIHGSFADTEKARPSGMGEVIRYLNDNYNADINMQELLRVSGMSQSSFFRSFRHETGSTPINYLLNIRMGHACELLRNRNIPISEVAARSGFDDSNYFSRLFKKMIGISPVQFRQQHKR